MTEAEVQEAGKRIDPDCVCIECGINVVFLKRWSTMAGYICDDCDSEPPSTVLCVPRL